MPTTNSVFSTSYLDIFAEDAFDNRREYIVGFYGEKRENLEREYSYLNEGQMDKFVEMAAETLSSCKNNLFQLYSLCFPIVNNFTYNLLIIIQYLRYNFSQIPRCRATRYLTRAQSPSARGRKGRDILKKKILFILVI